MPIFAVTLCIVFFVAVLTILSSIHDKKIAELQDRVIGLEERDKHVTQYFVNGDGEDVPFSPKNI